MPKPPRICVVGSCNIDLTFRTPRLPAPGETLFGSACHLGFGGKGANQAVAAARLNARVTMIGKVGRDAFGKNTVENFRTEKIDASHVTTAEVGSTGVAAIVVDDDARNAILVVPGANHALLPSDVRRAEAAIQSADVVLCQLEVPVATVLEALRIAKSAGVRTIFNPAPAAPVPDELFTLCDVCVPNETEIEQLTGLRAISVERAGQAARVLLQRGPTAVIVTLGDQGALIADALGIDHLPTVAVQAVDSSGAGDAFIGSLAVFWAEGLSLREAVVRANHVAALSVTRLGTQNSFPTFAEIEAYFKD